MWKVVMNNVWGVREGEREGAYEKERKRKMTIQMTWE